MTLWDILAVLEETPIIVLEFMDEIPEIISARFISISEEGEDSTAFFSLGVELVEGANQPALLTSVSQEAARALGFAPEKVATAIEASQKRSEVILVVTISGSPAINGIFVITWVLLFWQFF